MSYSLTYAMTTGRGYREIGSAADTAVAYHALLAAGAGHIAIFDLAAQRAVAFDDLPIPPQPPGIRRAFRL